MKIKGFRQLGVRRGFSLYEVLVAVAVLSVIAVFAIPQVQRASFRSKLAVEEANIALIQEAKEAYVADNPGSMLNNAFALLAYLPDQQLPQSPFGTEYKNLTDLSKPVTSGSSDVPAPQENNFVAIAKSEASGYNSIDGSGSSAPIVVLNTPSPSPTTAITPTPSIPTVPVTPTPGINHNPSVLLSSPSQIFRNQPLTLRANATDIDNDPLSYVFSAGGTTFASQGVNALSLNFPSLGVKPLSVVVSDGRGGLASATGSVEVVNQMPSVTISSQKPSGHRGELFRFLVLGSDPDSDPLQYSFNGGEYRDLTPFYETRIEKEAYKVMVTQSYQEMAAQPYTAMVREPRTGRMRPVTQYRQVPVTKTRQVEETQYRDKPVQVEVGSGFTQSFSTLGNQTVSVRAKDGYGGVSALETASVSIVNRSPVASLSASANSVFRNVGVTFTTTASDADNDSLSYTYTVDGQPLTKSSNSSITRSFSTIGQKNISVLVEDGFGGQTTQSLVISVVMPPPPAVTLAASPEVTESVQTITFTALSGDAAKSVKSMQADLSSKSAQIAANNSNSRLRSSRYIGGMSMMQVRQENQKLVNEQASLRNQISAMYHNANPTVDNSLIYIFRDSRTGRELQRSSSRFYKTRHTALGALPVTVSVINPENQTDEASAVSTMNDPVWDALVMYRRNNAAWNQRASNAPSTLLKQSQAGNKSLIVNAAEGVQGGFMTGTSDTMVNWLLNQGSLYSSLVNQVSTQQSSGGFRVSRDAVVVLTRLDPFSGQRVFQAGLIRDFGDPRSGQSPFREIKDNGNTHLDYRGGLGGTGWMKDFNAANDALQYSWKAQPIVVNGATVRLNVVGYQNFASPIILDLELLGEPDLLAGSQAWKKGRGGEVKVENTRSFNLDLTGKKAWEWVGPRAGILVWGSQEETPDATRLFGNHTLGESWKDGYEPLENLDRDKDDVLRGEELYNIFVWVDANSNAELDKGELKSLGELGIVEITAKPERDKDGNAEAREGFKYEDGRVGASWDWWSGGLGETESSSESDQSQALSQDEVAVYRWIPMEEGSKIPGGEFVFSRLPADGSLRLVSFVEVEEFSNPEKGEAGLMGFVFDVKEVNGRYEWKAEKDGVETLTVAVLEGDDLVGTTRSYFEGKELDSYHWVGVPKMGVKLTGVR